DICQKRFDVVLMNPPFGDPVVSVKAWTQETYPSCRNDIYGAFVLRGAALVNPEGRLGAITNRTGLFLGGYAEWRKQCVYGVLSHLLILCDLGSGVLDSALVETAMYVMGARQEPSVFVFRELGQSDKQAALSSSLGTLHSARPFDAVTSVRSS